MPFNNIIFTASYGDEDRNVIISAPSGAHGGGFNILVDNYLYQGVIANYCDGLKVCWQNQSPSG